MFRFRGSSFEVESFRENGNCLEVAEGNSVGIVEGKCVGNRRSYDSIVESGYDFEILSRGEFLRFQLENRDL